MKNILAKRGNVRWIAAAVVLCSLYGGYWYYSYSWREQRLFQELDQLLPYAYWFQVKGNTKETWPWDRVFSSDLLEMDEQLFFRFRSAVGAQGGTVDGCMLLIREGIYYQLFFATLKAWEECRHPMSGALNLGPLKRVTLVRNTEPWLHLELGFEFPQRKEIERWKFALFNGIKSQQSIQWDQQSLQQPATQLYSTSTIDRAVDGITVSAQEVQAHWQVSYIKRVVNDLGGWRTAMKCHEVDDHCRPLMPYGCELCAQDVLEVFDSKCISAGTKYCAPSDCGGDLQPACNLGREHIEQEEFKGCGPFSEQYFCRKGLRLVCQDEDVSIPFCRS